MFREMNTEELAQQVGDPKTIAREMKQASSDARLLDSRWEKLLKQHRGQWVGVRQRQFIFAGSLQELFQKARAKGWDLGTMVVDCLAEQRRAVLL